MEFLSLEILDFVERLAEKYNLDKEIEDNPLIKDELFNATSLGEKQFIKIIYFKIFPSLILKNIIKDYVNKNLPSSLLKQEIKEKLSVEEETAIKVSQEILNNTLINKLLEIPTIESPLKEKIIKTGLSQELE